MRFYNIIDEKGRFVELKVTDEPAGQDNSTTYSYLFLKEQYKELGKVMGLESEVNDRKNMEDKELKEKFEREFPALPVCPKCKAIEVKEGWIEPEIDLSNLYNGYREIYGNHVTEKYCRRCDPNISHEEGKIEVERRRK